MEINVQLRAQAKRAIEEYRVMLQACSWLDRQFSIWKIVALVGLRIESPGTINATSFHSDIRRYVSSVTTSHLSFSTPSIFTTGSQRILTWLGESHLSENV